MNSVTNSRIPVAKESVTSDTPVLLIIFNRKEAAEKAIHAISKAHPRHLYIAADGPRSDEEKLLVEETRRTVINAIDWECDIHTLFKDKNLGCGKAVYSAINWFFENEEQGIILEDDCIADISFFRYATEMLNLYADDMRIGMIAGYNRLSDSNRDYPYSIYFSRYKACWGWATWRRAWRNMDFTMEWRNTILKDSVISNSGYHNRDRAQWIFELNCIDNNKVSAWDWQWYFTLAAQNQLCIFPASNLIENIGNDINATHTSYTSVSSKITSLKFPLSIPPVMVPLDDFDNKFCRRHKSLKYFLMRNLPKSVKQKIKSILS